MRIDDAQKGTACFTFIKLPRPTYPRGFRLRNFATLSHALRWRPCVGNNEIRIFTVSPINNTVRYSYAKLRDNKLQPNLQRRGITTATKPLC